MRTKLFAICTAVALLAVGGGVWAVANSKAKTDCCYPGSACCYAGSPCCDESCSACCPECCVNCTEEECLLCCLELGCDPSCCFEAPAKPAAPKKSCCAEGCCK